jgi:hypothetical protein
MGDQRKRSRQPGGRIGHLMCGARAKWRRACPSFISGHVSGVWLAETRRPSTALSADCCGRRIDGRSGAHLLPRLASCSRRYARVAIATS